MDPMSAALAGLAIASALKDIIELAQKLDDSLAKVSTWSFGFPYLTEPQQVAKNMTKSKRLAEDIVKSLRQLEKVYQRYNATLVRSPDLKEAVDRLKVYVL